ncbi:MAG: 3'-5' exoribonuclease YhaM family protein [Candidatus Latescibacterota bacterium]
MMNEHTLITTVRDGDEFIGFYALKRCDLKENDGSFRLEIELADRSGFLPGVIWDDAKQLKEVIARGDVVKVKGRLGSYRDRPQVRVDKIRRANEGEYDSDAFIPSTESDVEALAGKVSNLIQGFTHPMLRQLGQLIFGDAQFMCDYKKAPGGSNWHHGCRGGLIEHSASVAEICDFIASRNYGLNRDLLVLAALLHDVGKIKEYSATTMIDFTDEGRLEGHIVIGERFVRAMCERIENFPPRLKMLLSHLMLSHHGHREFSSPVEPMIPEAFALYYADELDAKLDAMKRIMRECAGEGKSWSEYNRILGRYLFAGDRNGSGE